MPGLRVLFLGGTGIMRTVVPGYRAVVPFERGAREIVAWHDKDPARQRVDAGVVAVSDKLAATFRPGR